MPSTERSSSIRQPGTGARLRSRRRGVDDAWLGEALEAHELALRTRSSLLKNEHKTDITRIAARDRAAVVKHYRFMGWRFFLKGLFRRHPGRRSWLCAGRMAERRILTPEPLALIERRLLGLVKESWFIAGDLAGAVEMDRFVLRRYAGLGRRRRSRFAADFAAALRELLSAGIRHGDLKACNILVLEDGDGWRFAWIDLDDVRIVEPGSPIRREEWVQALSQLHPSIPKLLPRTDRLRFFNRLPELIGPERQELLAEVHAISRRRRRAYFSDAGPVEVDFE